MRSLFVIYLLSALCFQQAIGATIEIRPHAQWTFDEPMEEVIYRPDGLGFPISHIRTAQEIKIYDGTGLVTTSIQRYPGDEFQMNTSKTAFMLVQSHESIRAIDQKRIYSFQVFDDQGSAKYTSVVEIDLLEDILDYQLTDNATLLLHIPNRAWIMELEADDTLMYNQACGEKMDQTLSPFISVAKLKNRNEYITARTCKTPVDEDSLVTELTIWNQSESLYEPIPISGSVSGLTSLSGSDYYFLELDHGDRRSLNLFHRTDAIQTFPWGSWDIEKLASESVFIISEADLNVVNLGDGQLISSVHPIDMRSISDACYLEQYGLFLYLRHNSFYTKEGKLAFRDFELEGIERSGRIVHKSSFGSWSYQLPKIDVIGKDLFAIHLYNAVLLYRMELNR